MQILQGGFFWALLTFISIFKSKFVKISANFAMRVFLTNAYIHIYIQRGNVQCVQGDGEHAFEELDEIFYILQPNNIL
jgi:hypothetical protein